MVVFAMSCFGLMLFLWLAFGGPIPLRPEGYRLEASIPEATTLATEADVRMAGVNIGKVKTKELQKGAARTLVTLEIDSKYAPVPEDSRVILRQKTLLGETYVEITPGSQSAAELPDGGRLDNVRVEPTVELDEIFQAFDKDTKKAFQAWIRGSAEAIQGGRGQDLNDALGNLDDFARDGADILGVLDRQDTVLRDLVKNTGVVFRALSERDGELRSLISNSGRTFEAFASRDAAIEETFRIFPTFLDESRVTLDRLEDFSRDTQPLVEDLQPVADDLTPTIRDVAALAPDLRELFRDLDPLIRISKTQTPELVKVLKGASPVFDQLHPFLQELNPILAFANYDQAYLSTFITHGTAAFSGSLAPLPGTSKRHYLRAYGAINGRSVSTGTARPSYDRGAAYPAPNYYQRASNLGIFETFDCTHTTTRARPVDTSGPPPVEEPPCFQQPASLYTGTQFPFIEKDGTPELKPPPEGSRGTDGVPSNGRR